LNDRLSADQETAHRRDLAGAVVTLQAAADRLATAALIETAAVRDALAEVERLSMRLRARGGAQSRSEAEKALDAATRLITASIAPRLIQLLVAHTPVPGGPPSRTDGPPVIELAEFYRVITEWIVRREPRHPVISDLKRAVLPFILQARTYVEATENQMAGPDHPDLAAIAANVFRLDVLVWVLLTAGFPREAAEVQARTRRLARSAIRRASDVMRRCAATFSMIDRINLGGTMSEIDDLILIFQRVRDGEREEATDSGETFGQSLGAQVIADFAEAIVRLSRGIMEAFVVAGLDVPKQRQYELIGMLRALTKIYRLIAHLDDDATQAALGHMRKEIKAGVTRLAIQLEKAITEARAARDEVRLARLESVLRDFIGYAESMSS
jgi:hypothetical protein